jgi:nucleotide-binding universal stress UspA family protein
MSGIVVGVDGSEHARRALEWAMNQAGLRQAPLTVVPVHQVAIDSWGLAPLVYPEDEPTRQRAGQSAQEAVDSAIGQLSGNKPPAVQVKAVNGVPAQVLIDESKNAELLVVGTRGGGFEEILLGSVSTKVAHHAACPVVIVR